MIREAILKSDWHDWKQHKVTRTLVHDLVALREEYKQGWAEGKFNRDESEKFMGLCQGLADAIEYIRETFDVVQIEKEPNNGNRSS